MRASRQSRRHGSRFIHLQRQKARRTKHLGAERLKLRRRFRILRTLPRTVARQKLNKASKALIDLRRIVPSQTSPPSRYTIVLPSEYKVRRWQRRRVITSGGLKSGLCARKPCRLFGNHHCVGPVDQKDVADLPGRTNRCAGSMLA